MKKYLFHLALDQHVLFNFASFFSKTEGTCFFYSGNTFSSSQHSLLFIFPKQTLVLHKNPFQTLKTHLTKHFWAGYFTYEAGAYSDEDKKMPYLPSDLPLGVFQRYAYVFKIHHQKNIVELFFDDELSLLPAEKKWLNHFKNLPSWLSDLPSYETYSPCNIHLVKTEDSKKILKKIDRAKKYIFSGDVYQINLSHELILGGEFDPFSTFVTLAKKNPSPFSAYMNMRDYFIVSASPERLLLKSGTDLETRPIKGTVLKSKHPDRDINHLLSSNKEKAELAMITDLARNDLGRISVTNTVKTKAFEVEEYENIIHTLSIVQSKACPSIHPVDIIKRLFPGGSITGCPKLRAQEIIYELEQRARHIYTGSIGYFYQFDFDFNIAIRTMLFLKNFVSIQLGGAIVSDSDPVSEYHETLQKGISIFEALYWKNYRELYIP